jgi:hypothetical protein
MSRHLPLLATTIMLAAVEVEPAKIATADAAPLDPGVWELAVGASHTRAWRAYDADGGAGDRGGRLSECGASLGLTRGLVEGLDAGISLGWTRIDDRAGDPDHGTGPTDLELGAKWAFLTGDAGALALLPVVTAPLGRGQDHEDRIATAGRSWTAGAMLAASGALGHLAWNADAGYVHTLGSADSREGYVGGWAADAALGVQVSEALQPAVELSWARDRVEDGDAPWTLVLTGGLQCGLPCGRLGLGVQRTVAGALADETTTLVADLALAID